MNKRHIRDMKFGSKPLFTIGVAVLLAVISAHGALTEKFYANSSVLSSGTWVKIGVEETGVYEISYETLKKMGFNNPSKVSLYGRGGRVLSESFVTNAGVPVLSDDLTPVKVIHEDGKLYFYGLGPEEISFESSTDYETGGYFKRISNNIYTRRGYYFLTDSKDVEEMTEKNYDATNASKINSGVSYVYHELDSMQNTTNSGQLFWGEAFGHPGLPKRTWNVIMPDAMAGKGVMHCEIYVAGSDMYGRNASIDYGFEGTSDFSSTPYVDTGALYYSPQQPTVAGIDVPGNRGSVFVEFKNQEDMDEFANLDFWVVSYPSSVPSMSSPDGSSINQRLIAFPSIAKNTTGRLELADCASLIVLDVTAVNDPQRLKISTQGASGIVGVRNTGKAPVVVVFDKEKPQKQISGFQKQYVQISNQNLHAYKTEGADFIIITTPQFRTYAEEIAELHRQHDGLKVIVATTEECYNEFSGGTPDPMAYRSLAKMLYFSDRKPKNMLLLGPLYSDFRGLHEEHDPIQGIIAYQSPSISVSRGAHNINDFYGMMGDKFRTDYYERNDVQIGVGIIPIKFNNEARIIVDKIKNYLERDDHAYYLNRYTAIGGLMDNHTHETQVRDLTTHIRNIDNTGNIITPIPIDTYGNAEAHKKFINQLNEGCGMFSYFGHGAEMFIGKDNKFFHAGDVYKLRNRIHPLALFGGCQITNSDRGYRGIGETLVTNTKYGCIGSVVSARETWSGQNFEFFKQFFTCLYRTGSTTNSAPRTVPATIGEVFASVKNYSTYSNELAYQLLCDPALILPSINRSLSVKSTMPDGAKLLPGDKFTMEGTIIFSDDMTDDKFNGQVVIRLCEPTSSMAAGKIETGDDPNGLSFYVRDQQVAMAVADVRNGKFDAEIHIPASFASFNGKNALMYFAAYDTSTKVGAARCLTVAVADANQNTAETGDKISPVIERLEFDNLNSAVLIAVSDNVALNLSNNPLSKGLYLYIDGRERSEAHFVEPILETGRSAYSKVVLIDGLEYGEHTARLKVTDLAGNSSEHEIVFTYQPFKAMYTLYRSEDSTPDVTKIMIEGTSPESSSLVVLSSEGTEIWRGEFQSGSIEWNHEFSSGGKVPAGHYKAYLIETGSGNLKGHSEPIDIPVI